MNVLSLFDGMSCGQIALERAVIKVDKYFASEIDKYAMKVTNINYPGTVQLGNIENWKEWIIDWASIGLVLAGSPCQGFSFAGKGLNFNDPRSKLFFVFVEILNHIKKVNPNVLFILENVKMKEEHERIITKFLGVKPIRLNSSLVSAQNRQRLYWTNIPVNTIPKNKYQSIKEILEETVSEKYYISDTAIARINRKGYSQPKINPYKSGAINIKNNSGQLSVDSGTTLIISDMGTSGSYISNTNKVGALSSRNGCAFDNFLKIDINGKEKKNQNKSSCLTGGAHSGGAHSDMDLIVQGGIRRLTEVECERLQTVPDNYTNHVSSTQRYKMLGNGWTVDVIAHIFKHIKIL